MGSISFLIFRSSLKDEEGSPKSVVVPENIDAVSGFVVQFFGVNFL